MGIPSSPPALETAPRAHSPLPPGGVLPRDGVLCQRGDNGAAVLARRRKWATGVYPSRGAGGSGQGKSLPSRRSRCMNLVDKHNHRRPNQMSPWMTKKEVAALLQVSERTVSRLLAGGRLASVRVGRQVRVRQED